MKYVRETPDMILEKYDGGGIKMEIIIRPYRAKNYKYSIHIELYAAIGNATYSNFFPPEKYNRCRKLFERIESGELEIRNGEDYLLEICNL